MYHPSMAGGVTTELRAGQAVAVKQGVAAEEIARLEHEARLLRAAAHPGVVALVALERGDTSVSLVTAIAGRRTLDPSTAGDIDLLPALAETVADLHDLGVVHGRLEPDHVVVAPDGRPVLCGFGDGGLLSEGADPATDVRALGALLLAISDTTDDPSLATRLRSVAARATADEQSPSARSIAAALSRLEERSDPVDALRRGLRKAAREGRTRTLASRPLVVAGGLAIVSVLAAGTLLGVGGGGAGRPVPVAVAPSAPPSTVTTTTSLPSPTRVWPPPTADPVVVEANGATYELGAPGDRVALGDWDCDGTVTPALLRPSTGDVFMFDTWAEAGHDVTVRPSTRVPGARRVTAGDPDGDGCHQLVVETPDGPEVVG